jgi:hypothetical protein
MEALRIQQSDGTVEQVAGNKNSAYKFPKTESKFVHVTIQPGGFSSETGQPLSDAYVQKFTPEEFKHSEINRAFAGKTIEVLHDPSMEAKTSVDGSDIKGQTLTTGIEDGKRDYRTPLQAAREMYEQLSGEVADPSWGQVRLSNEIKLAQAKLLLEEGTNPVTDQSAKAPQENSGLSTDTPEGQGPNGKPALSADGTQAEEENQNS